MAAFVPLALGAGRMAMQALPYITALYGASEGAKEGGLLGALTGGGLGYLGGRLGTGYVSKGRRAATQAAPALAGKALGLKKGARLKPGIADVVKATGYAAVPLAAAGLAAPLVGRLAGGIGGLTSGLAGDLGGAVTGAGGNVLGAGTGISQALTKPSGDLPTIDPTGGLPTGAMGLPEALDPTGKIAAALAVERQLQDLQLEGVKKLTPYEYEVLSQMKKDDLARTLAGARGRQDIATQAQLIQQGQLGQQAMARQALADIGAGLRTQYNYG